MSDGIIPQCKIKNKECKYGCCKFGNNYIVLYPGELEKSKLNKSHLEIIDEDYFGGKKAICVRRCEERDFKPLDCKSYPFFPVIDKNKIVLLRGIKCPLLNEDLVGHKKWVLDYWNNLMEDKNILNWLKKVKLVGYSVFK